MSAPTGALTALQNPDGGWGYHAGSSWTEPTALALLALPKNDAAARRSQQWLARAQRPDGGWSPQPAIEPSGWVTSLAALALMRHGEARQSARIQRAGHWLMGTSGGEDGFLASLRNKLLGAHPEDASGWPWVTGSSSWAAPTAFAILALSKILERDPSAQARIVSGRKFLVARRCADGGWNHGGMNLSGETSASYPETTGIVLLAFAPGTAPASAIARARQHLRNPASADGANWLQMGLLAHCIQDEPPTTWTPRAKDVPSLALDALAKSARAGDHAFMVHA